jgi:hypothetical protein
MFRSIKTKTKVDMGDKWDDYRRIRNSELVLDKSAIGLGQVSKRS